jgi:MoaA/NifB/PqqE/SkfB family radical SAM enzyme
MSISPENDQAIVEGHHAKTVSVDSFPAIMYVESTRGCPYKCIMCNVPENWGTKSIDISDEILEKVQPYFQYLQVLGIHGLGEPLLSRKLDFFISETKKNDAFLHMNTTGFFLTEKLSDQLLDAKLSIRFSIHSGTPETYAKVMGNDLARVARNIGYLIEKSDREGHHDNDFCFSCIVMKDTLDEIEDFLRLADSVGVRQVRFMALRPKNKIVTGTTREKLDYGFSFFTQSTTDLQSEFLDRLPEIEESAKSLGISLQVGSMEWNAKHAAPIKRVANKISERLVKDLSVFPILKQKGDCMAPWMGQCQVTVEGDVRLCCSANYVLGNLHEHSFAEIWNGLRMQKIRQDFANGQRPRICGYCPGIDRREYPISSSDAIRIPGRDPSIASARTQT